MTHTKPRRTENQRTRGPLRQSHECGVSYTSYGTQTGPVEGHAPSCPCSPAHQFVDGRMKSASHTPAKAKRRLRVKLFGEEVANLQREFFGEGEMTHAKGTDGRASGSSRYNGFRSAPAATRRPCEGRDRNKAERGVREERRPAPATSLRMLERHAPSWPEECRQRAGQPGPYKGNGTGR